MSLFERIKNKRYDLQEQEKPKQLNLDDPWFDEPKSKGNNASTGSGADFSSTSERTGNKKRSKTKNKSFFDKVKHDKARKELLIKRKKYGIDPSGKIANETDAVRKYLNTANTGGYGRTTGKKSRVTKAQVEAGLKKTQQQMKDPKIVKQTVDKIVDKYGRRLSPKATKTELDATKKAIATSKTMNTKPLPKVFDKKTSKELGTDVFRRIRKKIPSSKTSPGKVIDTPTRRFKLLKPNLLKKISQPEIEKIIPKSNPRVTTTSFIGPSVPPRTTTTAATKLSKSLMKRKNIYAAGLGLALAGGLYLRNRGKNKEAEKKKLALLNVQKQKDKIQPVNVSLFLNKTGTSPNKLVDKSKQFTPSPYAFRPKNQPKPTYAKPTQYGSFDPKTNKMVQTTKKPKNINKNLP